MRHGFRWMLPGQFKFLSAKMVPKTVSSSKITAPVRHTTKACDECQMRRFDQRTSKMHMSAKKNNRRLPDGAAEQDGKEEAQNYIDIFDRCSITEGQRRKAAEVENFISHANSPFEPKSEVRTKLDSWTGGIDECDTSIGGDQVRADCEHLLKTSTGFARQFQVGKESILGSLLVDDPKHRYDFELWLCILRVQARSNQLFGVKQVWKGLRMRNIDIPVEGDIADTIWKIFIWTGNTDEKFLEGIWKYAEDLLHRDEGGKWPGLYEAFVGSLLVKYPRRAFMWHKRLVENYWGMESAAFFQRKSPKGVYRSLPSLHKIYRLVQQGKLYRILVPFLCDKGKFNAARKWHSILLAQGDLPETTSCLNLLVAHTCRHGLPHDINVLLDGFLGRPVSFNQSTVIQLIANRRPIKDVLYLLARYRPQVNEASLSDFFWLRLLSHWDVSLSQILDLMETYNVPTGPVWDKLRQLSLLSAAGMDWHQLGIPSNGNERVTYFTQEANSNRFVPREGNNHSAPNYLMTPTLPEPVGGGSGGIDSPELTRNRLLNDLIYQAKYREALRFILRMKSERVKVESNTIRLLVLSILVRRQVGRRPNSWFRKRSGIMDIQQAMWMLSWLIGSGIQVQPGVWREVLKRLGMLGRLKELNLLTHWLLRRYHPIRGDIYRRHHVDLLSIGGSAKSGKRTTSTLPHCLVQYCDMPFHSPLNPLKKLFPASYIRAIVEWGFLVRRPGQQLRTHHLTWGIRLARKMKDENVHVNADMVSRAVKVRLRALYGRRSPPKAKVAWARRKNKLHITELFDACEKAWGGKLNPKILQEEFWDVGSPGMPES